MYTLYGFNGSGSAAVEAALVWAGLPHRIVEAASWERSRTRLHALWDMFADTFPATPFLGGTEPSALDLLACVVSKWSGSRAHLRDARPAFSELLTRIEQHPRLKPVFDRHWPLP